MNFKQYLQENKAFDYDEFEDSIDNDEWIDDLDTPDDIFAVYTDEDEEDLVFEECDEGTCPECEKDIDDCECNIISERLIKKKVIRNGKKQIKWKSDRPGYKVVRDGNRVKEVKMSPTEVRMRKKQQKIGARKRKRTSRQAAMKRKRSLKRRTF